MYNDNFSMNPDEFFGDYFNYFNNPQSLNQPDPFRSLYIALGIVICFGIIFSFFFLRKKNENKFKGAVRIIYNFLNMNKFYAEEMLRLLNILSLLAISTTGIWLMLNGSLANGIALLVLGNIVSRIVFELIVMFIILCRKSVSIDRSLSRIEAFYSDDFDDGCSESCDFCDLSCNECECGDDCFSNEEFSRSKDECDFEKCESSEESYRAESEYDCSGGEES